MTPKAQEIVKYSLATHAAEKMIPSRKAVRLCEKIAEGQISGDSAVEQIKRSYGIESKHSNASRIWEVRRIRGRGFCLLLQGLQYTSEQTGHS